MSVAGGNLQCSATISRLRVNSQTAWCATWSDAVHALIRSLRCVASPVDLAVSYYSRPGRELVRARFFGLLSHCRPFFSFTKWNCGHLAAFGLFFLESSSSGVRRHKAPCRSPAEKKRGPSTYSHFCQNFAEGYRIRRRARELRLGALSVPRGRIFGSLAPILLCTVKLGLVGAHCLYTWDGRL